MNRHAMALASGLIGGGVGAYIGSDSDHALVYGAMGFAFGVFFGYFLTGLMTARGNLLAQDFKRLGDLRGKSLDEIVAAVGNYQVFNECTITDRDNEPGRQYTWQQQGYTITLLFGQDGKCIGVSQEGRQ